MKNKINIDEHNNVVIHITRYAFKTFEDKPLEELADLYLNIHKQIDKIFSNILSKRNITGEEYRFIKLIQEKEGEEQK